MRNPSAIALAGLLFLGGAQAAAAATYYVAPNGNDGGSGSRSSPWRTIAKAQAVAVGGDTVYFRGGAYTYPPEGLRSTNRIHHPPTFRLKMTGLRCAR